MKFLIIVILLSTALYSQNTIANGCNNRCGNPPSTGDSSNQEIYNESYSNSGSTSESSNNLTLTVPVNTETSNYVNTAVGVQVPVTVITPQAAPATLTQSLEAPINNYNTVTGSINPSPIGNLLDSSPASNNIGIMGISCATPTISLSGRQNWDEHSSSLSTSSLGAQITFPFSGNCKKAQSTIMRRNRAINTAAIETALHLAKQRTYELTNLKITTARNLALLCKEFHHKIVANKTSPIYNLCINYEPIHFIKEISSIRGNLKRIAPHHNNLN